MRNHPKRTVTGRAMPAVAAHDSVRSGLELLTAALTAHRDLFDVRTCLRLRLTCKELKKVASRNLTYAHFCRYRDQAPARRFFSGNGWPDSVGTMDVDIGIALHDLSAIAAAKLPKLENLSITICGGFEEDDVSEADEEDEGEREREVSDAPKRSVEQSLAVLSSASSSWSSLQSLRTWCNPLELAELRALLQGTWSAHTVSLQLVELESAQVGVGLVSGVTAAMWQHAFPNIERLTVSIDNRYNGTLFQYFRFPTWLGEADMSSTLRGLRFRVRGGLDDISALDNVTWLKHLMELEMDLGDIDLSPIMRGLEGNTVMTRLQLRVVTASTVGGYRLPSLPSLQRLHLSTGSSTSLLEAVCGAYLPALEVLECCVECCDGRMWSFLDFEAVRLLEMPRLRTLSLGWLVFTKEGFQNIFRILPQLDTLVCPATYLTACVCRNIFGPLVDNERADANVELPLRHLSLLGRQEKSGLEKLVRLPLLRRMRHLHALALPDMTEGCARLLRTVSVPRLWPELQMVSVRLPAHGYKHQLESVCRAIELWGLQKLSLRFQGCDTACMVVDKVRARLPIVEVQDDQTDKWWRRLGLSFNDSL
jgi:hypothetical protein